MSNIRPGRGFWKLNNSLLTIDAYILGFNNVIADNIKRYCATPYDPLYVLDVPRNRIQLTVDDQLFYECLLCDIRGFTIRFASNHKRNNISRESEIENELCRLEHSVKDHDVIYKIKQLSIELEEIMNKKLDGVFIRSKARWIENGEKPSKYF